MVFLAGERNVWHDAGMGIAIAFIAIVVISLVDVLQERNTRRRLSKFFNRDLSRDGQSWPQPPRQDETQDHNPE